MAMTRTLLILAPVIFAFPGVAMAQAVPGPRDPVASSHQVTAGAWGGVCYDGPNGEYRCRNFSVSESTNWFDGSQETRFEYSIYRSSSSVWGYRWLSCVVDRKSLNVTTNRAVFDAGVPDPTVTTCSGWGTLCIDGDCSDVPWTEPVEVKGEMTNPGYERTHVTVQTNRDNEYGIFSRQQCHGGEAGRIGGGGVSFSIAGGNFLYFPFGYAGTYGQANGQYLYDRCKNVGNE
jgi:hypothetical protein